MRSLRSLFGVALLFGVGYSTYKVLPIYVSAYQFEDAVKEEAKLSVYSSRSEDEIHDKIMKKAQELELPIQPDQVVVRRSPYELVISADYVVHVDLGNWPLELKFHPSSNGRRIVGAG